MAFNSPDTATAADSPDAAAAAAAAPDSPDTAAAAAAAAPNSPDTAATLRPLIVRMFPTGAVGGRLPLQAQGRRQVQGARVGKPEPGPQVHAGGLRRANDPQVCEPIGIPTHEHFSRSLSLGCV